MEGLSLDQIIKIAKQDGWIAGEVWIEDRIPRGDLEERLKEIREKELDKIGYLPLGEFAKYALRVLKTEEEVWVIGVGVGSIVKLYVPGGNPPKPYSINLTVEIENNGDIINIYAKNSENREIKEVIDLNKLGLNPKKDGFYIFVGTTFYEHVYNADHSEYMYPVYIIGAVAPRLPKKESEWPWEKVDIYSGSEGISWSCPHAGLLIYRPSDEKNLYIAVPYFAIGQWVAKYLESLKIKQEEERLAELAKKYSFKELMRNKQKRL